MGKPRQPKLRSVPGCGRDWPIEDVAGRSLKYLAKRSTCITPGLAISPRAIFSSVRSGTPLPSATTGQDPLVACNPTSTNSKMESDMAEHANPGYGVTQPGNGFGSSIAYLSMGRPKKPPRPVLTPKDVIGAVLAANIRRLMESVYRQQEKETGRIAALAGDSGIAKETIRRILARDVSPGIDTVQMLAIALGATAAQMLEPNKNRLEADHAKEAHARPGGVRAS